MPRKWNDAVAKFSEDTLLAYGIVPWHIQTVYNRLVTSFETKDIFTYSDYLVDAMTAHIDRERQKKAS